MISKILFTSLLLFNVLFLEGQTLSYRNLTTKDGLPSNTIYQIKQDKKGFIWIATANGLVRYDGRNFEMYHPKIIRDKAILGMFIDEEDTVWFWNLKGELFFKKDKTPQKFDFKGRNVKIKDFAIDNNGNYYFIDANQSIYKSDNQGNIRRISELKRLSNFAVFDNQIYILRGNSDSFIIEKDIVKRAINTKYTKAGFLWNLNFASNNDNQYLIFDGLTNNIYQLNKDGMLTESGFEQYNHLFKEGIVMTFFDKKQYLLVFTKKTIFIFNNQKRLIRTFTHAFGDQINTILHDREGNYWLSTSEGKIHIISSINFSSKKEFETVQKKKNSITSLMINGNDLLVGLQNNSLLIYALDKDKERLLSLKHEKEISMIYKDKKDKIWLVSYDRASLLNEDYSIIAEDIGKGYTIFKSFYSHTQKSELLIGTTTGVLNIPKDYFKDYISSKYYEEWGTIREKYSVKGINKRVYSIETIQDEFWFGSADGLYYYKNDSARITEIKELQESWITNIVNQNDTIWVGTQTDGVFQIIDKKIIKNYNETNGLISNSCKEMVIEDDGIIWVGTNEGINKININTNTIELINDLDGLLSNDITALVVDNNNVYVGTTEGLTSFDKKITTKNTIPPPIYLSNFQIFENDTILSDNYILDYNQDNIRIHFTGVSFRSQGTFTYKYRMLGISEKWIETQTDMASYPILNSGDYTFEAYAINEDGVESEEPIRIQIHIKTPFWETWWFRALVITAILLIIWGIIATRVNRVRERFDLESEFQQKINDLEMQALQVQMNPHFIFNVLNSIQHYLAINNSEQAMLYLSKFAKLIRLVFEYSKRTTISLTDEISFLKLYVALEKIRFKDKVIINFEIEEQIYTDEIALPPLLIQPMIENCFKHAFLHKEGKGNLSIQFFVEKKFLKCRITDNGIGRKKRGSMKKWKDKNHKSSGLSTTAERLVIWFRNQNIDNFLDKKELFKITDLENEAGEGIGTKVEMTLNICLLDEYE